MHKFTSTTLLSFAFAIALAIEMLDVLHSHMHLMYLAACLQMQTQMHIRNNSALVKETQLRSQRRDKTDNEILDNRVHKMRLHFEECSLTFYDEILLWGVSLYVIEFYDAIKTIPSTTVTHGSPLNKKKLPVQYAHQGLNSDSSSKLRPHRWTLMGTLRTDLNSKFSFKFISKCSKAESGPESDAYASIISASS